MDDVPTAANSLLQTLIERLILLEAERNAALGYLLDCVNRNGEKVDWPYWIRSLSNEDAPIRVDVAGKYAPLKEYLRESDCDYLEGLSRLVSVSVDRVSDNPLWKSSKG
jgi:hypothetical protein